ncbi:unnamed protein product [Wuchereria bancrofti]|uniref:Uncharacterized protein n=1 Tax=Wuchereria bancrofti TaxID=6293 RepID=A0A183XTW1_WUCBA|nr:unnamed protein product [Wuchereria bancrofti]
MTNQRSAGIFNPKQIWCKNFPSTSKLHDCAGIIHSIQEKNERKFDSEYTMKKFVQSWSLITYRRESWHLSLRNKQQLAETPSLNNKISTTEQLMVARNEKQIISKIKNMGIWRYEKASDDIAWQMGNERNEYKKWNFNWKWNKSLSIPFIPLLLFLVVFVHSPIQLVMAKLKHGNSGYCESNIVSLLATTYTVTPTLVALFGRTCRCAFDWRSHFCKQIERYKSLLAVPEMQRHEDDQLPIVCICRQLILENNCQQFMTQCYFTPENQHKECTCCFNQPNAFCNQLQCRNGEPIFGMHANTTCICHTPTFYPYNICTHQNSLIYDQAEVVISNDHDNEQQSDYIKYPLHESSPHHKGSTTIRLYDIQITPTLAVVIILGLLGMILLLTTILLVVRSCRTHREHRNRTAKRELAQSMLLEQRAEEEKYLP